MPWMINSREVTNFTYDLGERNQAYLAAFVAVVCHRSVDEIETYIYELSGDEALKTHVRSVVENTGTATGMDAEARFGRRLGWYAVVRATKPKVVVETGVDKGLGTCVIAAGLMRNADEGHPGKVYATDLNPSAGTLFRAPYDHRGKILYGDSIESLRSLVEPIDLFINDSDHSADYETREYETVRGKLSPGAIVLGDNAHVTTKLFEFSRRTGREFLFFQEEPKDHWYPGGGIGAAFERG